MVLPKKLYILDLNRNLYVLWIKVKSLCCAHSCQLYGPKFFLKSFDHYRKNKENRGKNLLGINSLGISSANRSTFFSFLFHIFFSIICDIHSPTHSRALSKISYFYFSHIRATLDFIHTYTQTHGHIKCIMH